jgi:adenylosuccinate lyase
LRPTGDVCPKAAGILHVGATSSFVGDNTDLIRMREGLYRIKGLLLSAIEAAASFADNYKDLHCLAYTHFQLPSPLRWENGQQYG